MSLVQRLLFCSLALTVSTAAYALTVPANDGYVTDQAQILSAEDAQVLESVLSQHRSATSNEIAILIVESLHNKHIADFAVEVGRKWGVGTKQNNNGILILMSYRDREVFIATGYGLEGAVPDIVANQIVDRDMVPHFKDGQYFTGLAAGVDALIKHIDGEYTMDRYKEPQAQDAPFFIKVLFGLLVLFFITVFLEGLILAFAPSREYWPGALTGFLLGCSFLFMFSAWLAIPFFTIIGFGFDFIVSWLFHNVPWFQKWVKGRTRRARRNRRSDGGWGSGGSFGGGSGRGGGFGGFGGGSFGGGGAGGRW